MRESVSETKRLCAHTDLFPSRVSDPGSVAGLLKGRGIDARFLTQKQEITVAGTS